MFELKTLSPEAIDRSIEKAERYRLLNEPEEAESICLDVLAVAPDNRLALVTMLLGPHRPVPARPAGLRPPGPGVDPPARQRVRSGVLRGHHLRAAGEHRLAGQAFGSKEVAFDLYRQAMRWYERAEELAPMGNEDALLRWNTCARQIMRHKLAPAVEDAREPILSE